MNLPKLTESLRLQAAQLTVFQEEFQVLTQRVTSRNVFARLCCIASQPLSGVISRSKTGCHATIVVKILFGVTQTFDYPSVFSQFGSDTRRSESPIYQRNPKEVDLPPVFFMSQWQSLSSQRRAAIRSQSPFIVITNDGQLCEAEGILLHHTLFARLQAIPWLYFVNTFQ